MHSLEQRFLAKKFKGYIPFQLFKIHFVNRELIRTCALEKKLAKTRNKVTSIPIRPGTTLGSIIKLIPPINTNTAHVT